MNASAADDLEAAEVEAADLLALARLDDDGAPCLSRSQPTGPYPDNDRDRAACCGSAAAAADDPARGQRRARRGRFGRPAPAAAATATGRSRQRRARPRRQVTPAVMGVG